MGALDWNKIVHQHQGWRLISCIWLHAGLIHLVVNMLSLLFIGIRLEQQFGFGKLIIVPNHYNCNFYDMISNILTFCLKDCFKKIFSWYANVDLAAHFLLYVSFFVLQIFVIHNRFILTLFFFCLQVRIGAIYLLSGFGGSVLSALFLRNNYISVGASGALFGLLGSMLSELLMNWTIYSNKVSKRGG